MPPPAPCAHSPHEGEGEIDGRKNKLSSNL
jgi:hypothetical protein